MTNTVPASPFNLTDDEKGDSWIPVPVGHQTSAFSGLGHTLGAPCDEAESISDPKSATSEKPDWLSRAGRTAYSVAATGPKYGGQAVSFASKKGFQALSYAASSAFSGLSKAGVYGWRLRMSADDRRRLYRAEDTGRGDAEEAASLWTEAPSDQSVRNTISQYGSRAWARFAPLVHSSDAAVQELCSKQADTAIEVFSTTIKRLARDKQAASDSEAASNASAHNSNGHNATFSLPGSLPGSAYPIY